MKLLPLKELKSLHPSVNANLLSNWARRSCPMLGRPIQFKMNGRQRLYEADDIQKAMSAKNTAPLPDQFTDARGTWIWAQLAPNKPYHLDRVSLHNWSVAGCLALGGKKLEARREHSWHGGIHRRRDYLRTEDLGRILRAREEDTEIDKNWMAYSEASKHLSPPTLTAYSNSGHYHRSSSSAPKAHPVLGRMIKTEVRKMLVNGRTVTKVLFWRPDIEKLLREVALPQWATWNEAVKEYAIPVATLEAEATAGRIRVQKFAVAPSQGKPLLQRHFFRPDLNKVMLRRAGRSEVVKVGSQERLFAGKDGNYWPAADASARSGAHTRFFKTWRASCPHLGGRAIRSQYIEPKWKSSRTRIWVYHEDDLAAIGRALRGEAEPEKLPTAASPNKRNAGGRGRPSVAAADEVDRRTILERWKDAKNNGTNMGDFCSRQTYRGKPLTIASLKAISVWASTRARRAGTR